MKIALVHDYLKEYGGAERVLEALHEMYPDASVYTLLYAPQFLGPHRERFASWNIQPSFLQYMPFSYKFVSIFRLFAPFVFRTFDFSGYDVIIVSATGAYSPNIIRKQHAKQICYCHTPPRYLYGYATAREWKKNPVFRILAEGANHVLRMVDFQSSKYVDIFVANSENVKKRIEKFYRRSSVVIYPPVIEKSKIKNQISNTQIKNKKLNASLLDARRYYLAGGRLARPKHFELIIQAAAELGIPLKIFGKGFAGYEKELQDIKIVRYKDTKREEKTAPNILVSQYPSIHFLGEVTDEEKFELMKNAKAFIIAAEDEDFGIVPVEAMSVGTPVIAYRSGGLQESVIDGKTGVFFDELTVESLKSAIKRFEKTKIDLKACIKQAEKFSKEKFEKEIKKIVFSIKSS